MNWPLFYIGVIIMLLGYGVGHMFAALLGALRML